MKIKKTFFQVSFYFIFLNYFSLIASTGQTRLQVPQFMHFFISIKAQPS